MNEKTPPLVSIVVPSWNHEIFIEECLASVFKQTYPSIEIIVVDDGSIDDSVEIIKRFIGRHGRFPVNLVVQQNQGAHNAINNGVMMASGKYINILNSDDYFSGDRIEHLVSYCEKGDVEIAFTTVIFVDHHGNDISTTHPLAIQLSSQQAQIHDHVSVGFAVLNSNVAVSSGNLFFTKTLFERLGGFRNYKYCHDWDFILRAMRITEPNFIDRSSYFYRIHRGNTYGSLQDIAMSETIDILWDYLATVERDDIPNYHAPSERNWPYYFDYFIGDRKRFISDKREPSLRT